MPKIEAGGAGAVANGDCPPKLPPEPLPNGALPLPKGDVFGAAATPPNGEVVPKGEDVGAAVPKVVEGAAVNGDGLLVAPNGEVPALADPPNGDGLGAENGDGPGADVPNGDGLGATPNGDGVPN